MTIEISNALAKKIIAFCNDELNYHINESGCADEYADEIEAQIELLKLLGKTSTANKYAKQFKEYMADFDEEEEFDDDDYGYNKSISPNEKYLVEIYSLDTFYDLNFDEEAEPETSWYDEKDDWFVLLGSVIPMLDDAGISYKVMDLV